jgi:transcriptional regulator with XRE-family HTH domain
MTKELWQITGSRQDRTFTVKVRAASYREAVRLGGTTHMLVVRDCVLLDETSLAVLQAKCIAAAPSITPPTPPSLPPAPAPPPAPPVAAAPVVVVKPPRPPRQPRKKIFTDEVLAQIPELVGLGLSRAEIAERLGCKRSSLQTVCSINGISLWHRGRRRASDGPLTLALKPQTLARLQKRAEACGISETKLASRLLDLIVKEDLYDAVLDEAAI